MLNSNNTIGKLDELRIIYLACPYTHPLAKVRKQRFLAATKAAAHLISRGHVVYSPITMTHPIDILLAGRDNTLGTEFWGRFDEAFMEKCTEMAILPLDGWQESGGIRREREYFEKRGRPVWFMNLSSISDLKSDPSISENRRKTI